MEAPEVSSWHGPTMFRSVMEPEVEHGGALQDQEVMTMIGRLRDDMESLNNDGSLLLEPSEAELSREELISQLSQDVQDFLDELMVISNKTPLCCCCSSSPSCFPGKNNGLHHRCQEDQQIRRRRVIADISGLRARAREATTRRYKKGNIGTH